MRTRHILVIGCGSVGKRHAENLKSLGCRVSGMDPRADRLDEAATRIPLELRFATLEAAFDHGVTFDGAVIASPPTAHVAQALACLDRRIPLLLEKPVAPDLASARTLLARARVSAVPVLLGYTFRWWPPVLHLKELLGGRATGDVLRVQMVMAAHLADWHPWERYQDFFMAKAALGGGALLDESHFLDLMLWLFGWPQDLSATVERLSALEIDTDDNVDVSLALPSGTRVGIHLDLYARPHERSIRVFGDAGTVEWNNEDNCVRRYAAPSGWSSTPFTCQRNDMFLRLARHYLDVLDGAPPECTLLDGCRVLQLVEAIRDSDRERRTVDVPEALTG